MINRRTMLQVVGSGALLGSAASRVLAQPAPAAPAPAATPNPNATLGTIRGLTLTSNAPLDVVEKAWTQHMGYKLIGRGKIMPATAASWDAPGIAGKSYVIVGPASGEATYLRFIDQPAPANFDRTGTYGWNNVEITVQNNDELYEKLKDSPFIVRGPPRGIPTYNYLKALGATGPGGERLALTWITEKRPDLAEAKSFVGKCFIATQVTPDLPKALEWFKASFGNTASPIRQLPNMQLSVITLKEGAKIEVDGAGADYKPRDRAAGGLPPGLAVVTFDCSSFDKHVSSFIKPPAKNAMEPFTGKQVGTLRGPGGELIELLQT